MDRKDAPQGEQEIWEGVDSLDDPEEVRVAFSALDSFAQYAKTAHFHCTHMRRQAFYALPQAHWQMLAQPPFNYLETLDRIDDAIESNADLARAIVQSGLQFLGVGGDGEGDGDGNLKMPAGWSGVAKHGDLDKARSTIRQFFRDWSAAGASERDACHNPIFAVVDTEKARLSASGRDVQSNDPLKVLVPGAGLGRLVFDLCRRGCLAEGNEISYHQLLASSYILNVTERANQHTIYPWIHSFSNHPSRESQFRSYTVPDVHPPTSLAEAGEGVGSMQMCAADFLCLYNDESHANTYDIVAAVFFLDTAPNLIRYLETIRHCLRPGGALVNVGPLLWHWENTVPGHQGYDGGDDDDDDRNANGEGGAGIADPGSFELTDDEVMSLVEKVGFVVEKRTRGVEAPYIQDTQSMLQTVYKASSWVARKPEN